jgi:hypothetical protein
MKIRKINKKSQSLMISYVILISIVIAISIGVFVWLKDIATVEPPINCKEGTSIILTDITCSSSGIDLNLKNNGRFSIDGIILIISDESELTNPTYLIPVNQLGESAGSAFFEEVLKPGENVIAEYTSSTRPFVGGPTGETGFGGVEPVSFSNVKSIQIQPFIFGEKGGVVTCQDALIKQDVEGCNIGEPFNPLDLQGLISWWSFGNDYYDSFGGNTLNPTGGPTFVGRKSTNDAISFDGLTQYAQAASPIQLSGGSYTITMWANLAEKNQTHTQLPFLIQIGSGGVEGEGRIFMRFTGNLTENPRNENFALVNYILRVGESNTGENVLSSKLDWEENQWYFFAGTYNSDTGDMSLYVDGNHDKTDPETPNFMLDTTGTAPFIGKSQHVDAQNFNGSIDEVMIFNETLSQENITALYNYQK